MSKKYISESDVQYQLANLRQLTFEVTDACNLSCSYCAYGDFYNDYDKRDNNKMNLSAAIRVIDYLVELWNSNQNMSTNRTVYISFYGGEPLLNMFFIKTIVDYIENIECDHRKFIFSMTTNALLLDKYMSFLVEHSFNLLISLDGNEYNTSYRVSKSGKPAYNTIIRNVEVLRKKYPDYFENNVNFNAVLHNRNSIEEIYKFFKDRYNKIPSIGELNSMGIAPDKINLFRATYRNVNESLHQSENYEEIEQAMFLKTASYKTLSTFIHRYSGFVFRNYNDLLFGQCEKNIPTGTCIPFSRKMFITVNGKIMPCERIGQQFALGKVTSSAVELDLNFIADKYNAYFSKLEQQCSKCRKTDSCIQCIFNLNNLDNSPTCYGYTNEQTFNVYKKQQMDFLRKHPEAYFRIMEEVIIE